jgi:phosphoserine aminotransferase
MNNQLFFTPGPSQLYHTVPFLLQKAIQENIGAISHRSGQFQDIFKQTKENLRTILNLPEDYHILLMSSATEIWERIVQNLIVDHSYHYVNGSFSKRFFEFTIDYQLKSKIEEVPYGDDFPTISKFIDTELISLTFNETSIGYCLTNDQLKSVRSTNPQALIVLDVVSISPAVEIDFSLVDSAYFSVQKCFGLPAGLAVWIVNNRCIEKSIAKRKSGKIIGSYHSLPGLVEQATKNQTPETPNVLSLYLLKHVTQNMIERGILHIQNETKYKAAVLYQAFDSNVKLDPFIQLKVNRSPTVCVASVNDGNETILKIFKNKGLILGSGYGPFKNSHIRIANFPAHSKEQIEMIADLLASY